MKNAWPWLLLIPLLLLVLAASSNKTAIRLGLMETDFNAGGHCITNIHCLIDDTGTPIIGGGGSTGGVSVTFGTNITIVTNLGNTLVFVSAQTDTNNVEVMIGAATNDVNSRYVPLTRTITIDGTSGQIISSAGSQDLSANRTWTLSHPATLTNILNISTPGHIVTNNDANSIVMSNAWHWDAAHAISLSNFTTGLGLFLNTDNTVTQWNAGTGLAWSGNTLNSTFLVPITRRVTSDVANSTTNAMTTVSDLTFSVTSGHFYTISADLFMTNTWDNGVTVPAALIYFDFAGGAISKTAFRMSLDMATQNGSGANGPTLSTIDAFSNVALNRIYPDDTLGDVFALTVGGGIHYKFTGYLVPSSSGTFIPRFSFMGSGAPGTVTLKTGSHMTISETSN